MKKEIKWADNSHDRRDLLSPRINPFGNGQFGRPLRITFHNTALTNLPEHEQAAIEILYEFAKADSPNLFAVGMEPGELPFIEIGEQSNGDYIPVTLRYADGSRTDSGIMFPEQFPELAAALASNLGGISSDNEQALKDLLVARAHHAVQHDILVTNSKWLLGNSEFSFVNDANPCLPSEAIKIMGLLLRARGDFRYGDGIRFNKGLFYWVLTRYKLPAMWRYFNACVQSEKLRGDDTLKLGQSILIRCERAIQARDEIGRLFYFNQNNDTRDEMMYHFDYLTLLLSGAIDAQSRVAFRAYRTTVPSKERNVRFRDDGFVSELAQRDQPLGAFLSGDYFKNISSVISIMRNTIHGAGLTTLSFRDGAEPEKSFVNLPSHNQEKIRDICEKYGSAQSWGIKEFPYSIVFEPYTFSENLLIHSLEIINTIASLTKVELLFPENAQVPEIKGSPDENDRIFHPKIGERLALLS